MQWPFYILYFTPIQQTKKPPRHIVPPRLHFRVTIMNEVENGHPTDSPIICPLNQIDFLHFSQIPLSHFRSAAVFGINGE